jgi:hypothetical protein
MKYLLFVYYLEGEKSEGDINQIASELSPIVDSDEIKYVFGPSHAVYNFATEMVQPELSIYIDILQEDIGEFKYILVPTPKVITSNMEPEHLQHLMNVNGIYGNDDDLTSGVNFIEFLKENMGIKNKDVCYLSVDQILEKIKESGMKSLTIEEKEKLDNYSQTI